MNVWQDTLEALKAENNILNAELQELKEKLLLTEEDKKHLREAVGAWRRKALDKQPIKNSRMNERHFNGLHTFEVPLRHLPRDLSMAEVMTELKEQYLASVYPYQYHGLYCHHKEGWIVRLCSPLHVDLSVKLDTKEEEFLKIEAYDAQYKHLFPFIS
ncbi:hypothetical protein [Pseudobacillus badius]|uniref:hypothetical protein n=1 Tax=Bacillus badius TaxID=1455 RepID=UPI0007B3A456|nr:hypothetical protein [Bacillus badius]KZR57551.1 hypothetical protein A3781_01845 [Bacillus badius]